MAVIACGDGEVLETAEHALDSVAGDRSSSNRVRLGWNVGQYAVGLDASPERVCVVAVVAVQNARGGQAFWVRILERPAGAFV